MPGVTLVKTYRPASFVFSVREIFVAVSVKVAVTPGTTAPDGSDTVPATVPVSVNWADAGKALPIHSRAEQRENIANREEKIWRRTRIATPRDQSDSAKGAGNAVMPLLLLTRPQVIGVQKISPSGRETR